VTVIPTWEERSPLSAAIQNPPLIAGTIAYAAKRYRATARLGMPWELAFLVPPLVLGRVTREALPSSGRTHLPRWVSDNQLVLAGWPTRARKFVPYVHEALRVGLRAGLLEIEGGSRLRGRIPTAYSPQSDTEVREILQSAAVLGAVFAKAGEPASVFTLLGVSP
jgi:hypothetical protein